MAEDDSAAPAAKKAPAKATDKKAAPATSGATSAGKSAGKAGDKAGDKAGSKPAAKKTAAKKAGAAKAAPAGESTVSTPPPATAPGDDPHVDKTAEKLAAAEEAVTHEPAEPITTVPVDGSVAKNGTKTSSTAGAAEKPAEKTTPKTTQKTTEKTADKIGGTEKPARSGTPAKDEKIQRSNRPAPSFADLRVRVAQVIRVVTSVFALVLAVGALLIALRSNINETNPIVRFITDLADAIDGPFSRDSGIFTFTGKNGVTKEALVNWGLAAIVWLVIGRVLDVVIRPRGRS